MGRRPADRRHAILRTASFRLALGASLILAASSAVEFGLIAWNTARFERVRTARLIAHELATMADDPAAETRRAVERHFDSDLHAIPVAALFDRDGQVVAGNLQSLPAGLAAGAPARRIAVAFAGGRRGEILAASAHLRGGGTLVIGREMREVASLRRISLAASFASFLPALLLSLAGGAILGHRALVRVGDMHRAIERIVGGDLRERLPADATDDEFARLAGSINRMLDRIVRLMEEVRGVGDDIAHDLRTPLSHVRATLERLRDRQTDPAGIEAGLERALAELERVFAMITALLRIAELEGGARRAGFGPVSLRAVASDVIELYEPLAEGRAITVALEGAPDAEVTGDAELLTEALANLLDNAIKFTQPGGRARLTAGLTASGPLLAVEDDGIGLTSAELGQAGRRFWRADRSRHVPGSGLGLSLVGAIAAIHGAEFALASAGRGCRAQIAFGAAGATGTPGPGVARAD